METMSPRQRVLTTLAHQEPDRVPFDLPLTIASYNKLRRHLGLPATESPFGPASDIAWVEPKVLSALGVDFIRVHARGPKNRPLKINADGTMVDEWGITRQRVDLDEGIYYVEMVGHPLKDATREDLERYPWPDPYDEGRIEGLATEAKFCREQTDYAVVGHLAGSIWEMAAYLCGFESLYLNVALNPGFIEALLDKLCELQMAMYTVTLREAGPYIDILRLAGEDLGTQMGPMISPEKFRQIVKPRLKTLVTFARDTLRQYNPNGKVLLHSCGDIYPFIEDFIECGVDILDPLQPRAAEMDHQRIKAEYGDRLCFHGGIDIQHTLPFGTPAEVAAEVRQAVATLGQGGGYILAPAHNVQGDVPPENLMAMAEAVRKGSY